MSPGFAALAQAWIVVYSEGTQRTLVVEQLPVGGGGVGVGAGGGGGGGGTADVVKVWSDETPVLFEASMDRAR